MKVRETEICEIDCPYCDETLKIVKETTTHSPAVPAEKNTIYRAEKTKQTKLVP